MKDLFKVCPSPLEWRVQKQNTHISSTTTKTLSTNLYNIIMYKLALILAAIASASAFVPASRCVGIYLSNQERSRGIIFRRWGRIVVVSVRGREQPYSVYTSVNGYTWYIDYSIRVLTWGRCWFAGYIFMIFFMHLNMGRFGGLVWEGYGSTSLNSKLILEYVDRIRV